MKSSFNKELAVKDAIITSLQSDKLLLENELKELKENKARSLKKNNKTYDVMTRLMFFNCLLYQAPTSSISPIVSSLSQRLGVLLDCVPHRTSVDNFVRELGVISDLQAAEVAMKTPHLTLGFDSTTQEGVLVNSVHLTTPTDTFVIALDQLSGGRAEDYEKHLIESIKNLAYAYSDFHKIEFSTCHNEIIKNISNTMSDRASVNHASIVKLNALWGKTLNELNCHLHPLDSISKGCRLALKSLQTERSSLIGSDCIAGNIVLQIDKLRYRDGKGDPKNFISFLLNENLPKGLIPRYRGNRLHVFFHTCGILVLHYDQILSFLKSPALSSGSLISCLHSDLNSETGKKQLFVMGMVGKLLTSPWMKKFYIAPGAQAVSHLGAVTVIKEVLAQVDQCLSNPFSIFTRNLDFFGEILDVNDPILEVLLLCPQDKEVENMIKASLSSIAETINRQYKRYLSMNVSDLMSTQTESARLHNMDSEEVIGMFSAAKKKAPNATMCYMSSRIRSLKNRTVAYLDSLSVSDMTERVTWAIGVSRSRRQANRVRTSEVTKEIALRAEQKNQETEQKERKKIEKLLRQDNYIDKIKELITNVTEQTWMDVQELLSGNVIDRLICHYWYSAGPVLYSGRVKGLKKGMKDVYLVKYWLDDEDESRGVDYDMSKYQLACDILFKDLTLL
ncbi:uncharacterized protein LOC129928088 [Biomphalaria glabrata]|uniref:Uncharacterized protein LOC129928088 n=1 Tax=Biomphalaria glabrata TaxID=6526 RepID=A0A9W3BAP9_BIOGL|nr:uncharacterized protein LOC129928088 [Biomphalaria glabrata]XP_055896518.1 uncharacterized protein LOC129928088 [Biomphalaria glabrata]